jgi:hypothetical protein
MRTLAPLTGLTVATVLTGMVILDRTANKTPIALVDQSEMCAECAIQQPISDADITQQPRSGACDGCTLQQSNEPTILPETTYATLAPSTEKLAGGISNCADCATEKPDGPGVPITATSPSVKLTEHAEGCTSCAQERSRRQPPQHQSGRLKQRQAPQSHSSEPTRGRHAAHPGLRQQSAPNEDFPFSVEMRRAHIDADVISSWDE